MDLLYILRRNVGQNIQISGENCGDFHAKCPFMLNADVKNRRQPHTLYPICTGEKTPRQPHTALAKIIDSRISTILHSIHGQKYGICIYQPCTLRSEVKESFAPNEGLFYIVIRIDLKGQ